MEGIRNPNQVEIGKTLLVSPLEKSSSHGKCEEKGQEDVMSKLAGVHEEENSGTWGRPRVPLETQGPLCLEGAALSLWGQGSVNHLPVTRIHFLKILINLILIHFAHLGNQ